MKTLLEVYDEFMAMDGSANLGIPAAEVRAKLTDTTGDWYAVDPEATPMDYEWVGGAELLQWDDDDAGYGSLETGLYNGKPAYALSFCGNPLSSAQSYFLVLK
jgi:hypothetical protein